MWWLAQSLPALREVPLWRLLSPRLVNWPWAPEGLPFLPLLWVLARVQAWRWPPSEATLADLRWLIALGAIAVLTWDLFCRRSPAVACGARPDRTAWLRSGLLGVLALAAVATYFNFNYLHYDAFARQRWIIHRWDMMHYYLGAKYFPENGYERLYLACLAAERDSGRLTAATAGQRKVRLMESYEIAPVATVLDRLDHAKARFAPERWAAFQRDLATFQKLMPGDWYQQALYDHGYNPSPIWNAVGSAVTSRTEATREILNALALIDTALMAVMFAAIGLTFGLRPMLLCVIVFAINYPGRWHWTGGSLLRLDWLAALGLALCALRRRWWVAGGALLAYAAGVRGFPLVVLFGPVVLGAGLWWRLRRAPGPGTPAAHDARRARLHGLLRLGAGFAATGVLLAAWAVLAAGSWRVWPEWLDKMRLHSRTALTNNMGLPVVVAYDEDRRAEIIVRRVEWAARAASQPAPLDPYRAWKVSQLETFQQRRLVYVLLVAGALVLAAAAVWAYPPHVAAAFSLGLVFVGFNLTCYYYAFLCLLPLAAHAKRLEWVGIGLLALCIGQYMIAERIGWYDRQYASISELTGIYLLIAAGVMIAGQAWARRRRPGPAPRTTP